MKAVILAVVAFLAVCAPAIATQCSVNPVNVPRDWISIHGPCRASMRRQIQMEVRAALQYLAMGAHFSRDATKDIGLKMLTTPRLATTLIGGGERIITSLLAGDAHRAAINRPGFAKLFFDAASEEREHAMKLIDYLLMRGELTNDVTSLIKLRAPENKSWENGVEALEQALMMENEVTKSIRTVIASCEDDPEFNDYHLADYLTGEFLEEQYKGQRDLAGKATTLKKMLERHSALGEFLFDKKLLGMNI